MKACGRAFKTSVRNMKSRHARGGFLHGQVSFTFSVRIVKKIEPAHAVSAFHASRGTRRRHSAERVVASVNLGIPARLSWSITLTIVS